MSTVGKIFVFFVLIFSLMQGGLVVVVYTTRTSWAERSKELEKQAVVSRAVVEQLAAERQRAIDNASKSVAASEEANKKLQDELKTRNDQIAELQNKEQNRRLELTTLQSTVSSLQIDVKRHQADNEKLKDTLTKQMKENENLVTLNATLRQDKTTAEIKANALLVRNTELETKVEELARENARMRSPLAGGSSGAKTGTGKNPPPEKLEGLVLQADPSGMVKITLGSDAGLMKGHTLEVYRLSNIADQSKYLGTIRILEVNNKEAVGQPLGRMTGPMQVGDTVASRILGN